MNEHNNKGIGLSLGVLSAFLLVQVPMLLTPAINTIAEQFGISLSVS